MLISRQDGNWMFLAAILTRMEFAPDKPIKKRFGDADAGDPGLL